MVMIASYNKSQMGDVLVVILGRTRNRQEITKHDDVVKITDKDGKVIGFNFLNASKILPKIKKKKGQVNLSEEDIKKLNEKIGQAHFKERLVKDDSPKFVVGYVEELKNHPDSDHLKIAKVNVGDGKTLQIVSGSPNMKQGVYVVVAKVGAMMPNGEIIWPGELRGIESDGMMCSGRELKIKNAPDKPGALLLPDTYKVGSAFDFNSAKKLFK